MAEFKEVGDRYVSKSGNDANPGTDPDNPKLTITSAKDAATSNQIIVIGAGVYDEAAISEPTGLRFIGDSLIIMKGDGTNDAIVVQGNTVSTRTRMTYTNYLNIFNKTSGNCSGLWRDCVFDGGFQIHSGSGEFRVNYQNCIFINCNLQFNSSTIAASNPEPFDACIFINSTVQVNSAYATVEMKNCYGDKTSSADGFSKMENCVWNGSKLNIDVEVNVTDVDPLFLGDPNRFEFVVDVQSPLIGGGIAGINIGNVKIGEIQNSSTQEWGLFPAVNTDTVFNGIQALIVDGATVGSRESQEIDLGQVLRSPTLRLNGLSDFLNSVPDFNNALVNPNSLTCEVSYAGLDKIFTSFKAFRWNEKIQLDNTNKSTGEAGFDWTNLVDQEFRFMKVRPTVRDDYTPA